MVGNLLVYPTKNGKIGHMAICTGGLKTAPGFPTKHESAVLRAWSFVGKGVYGLGRGGWKPGYTTPFDSKGRCDCSGFAYSWCYQQTRYDPSLDKWWNTTSIYSDAKNKNIKFKLVADYKDMDFSKLEVIHCHGGKSPAITVGNGKLWNTRKGALIEVL